MSLNIVLVEPEIPWNTGAIARTCGLTHSVLHLIKPLGFSLDEKHLKRAGLDYWDLVDIRVYENLEEWIANVEEGSNFYLATTHAKDRYSDVKFKDGDYIVFGPETRGLDKDFIRRYQNQGIRIPMLKDFGRSLNLANSVNIILYEALRQQAFLDLE